MAAPWYSSGPAFLLGFAAWLLIVGYTNGGFAQEAPPKAGKGRSVQNDFPVRSRDAKRPAASNQIEASENAAPVKVPTQLASLRASGKVPSSLQELQVLEEQFQKVIDLTAPFTVNVEIGPAQGGGVVVSASGYILTAAHVAMKPGRDAVVRLHDGRRVTAKTLGMNREFDAGVMKINPGQNGGRDWPHASLGKSDPLRPGMWCIAMGHPGGYDEVRGPVARVGRLLETNQEALVTDCALIGGDSGGPLFDLQGKLIAIHSRIGNDVRANLHVPIDRYEDHWMRMASGESWGYLPNFKPWLGVSGRTSTDNALLTNVAPGSPAQRAGLKKLDVILEFNDEKISDFQSLLDAVAETMPGERVMIIGQRDLRTFRTYVEIGRQDDD